MQPRSIRRPFRAAAIVALLACLALAGAAGAEGDEGWTIEYSNGLSFDKNDGQASFKLGGRIHADFAAIAVERALDALFPGGDGQGVELRRAYLYMSGELYERVIWKSQFDFAGSEVNAKDVYIGVKGLGFLGTAKVGHFKEPYSLEELTSDNYITFMERALPSVFNPSRNFGLGFSNAISDQRMTWAAGVFADTDGGAEAFSTRNRFNITGRVTGLPVYADEGRRLIHLGVAGGFQVRDDTEQRLRQRPEIHLAQRYLDTRNFHTDGNRLLGVEVAAVCGPLHLASEWKQSWIDQVGGKNLNVWGTYVSGGWFLTGESRPYKKSSGTWSRVKPANPFDPDGGKWGALELAARFSYLNLNSHNVRGGREANVSVGLNWYLYSNVRLMANYVYANVMSTGGESFGTGEGKLHGVQARAQIEF